MGIKEEIIGYLKRYNVIICDDCMTKELRLSRRQVAYQYCNKLSNDDIIKRDDKTCGLCYRQKKCSWINNKVSYDINECKLFEKNKDIDRVNKLDKHSNDVIETNIRTFMNLILDGKIEVYNEFSIQHELGIYLRKKIGKLYKIQFERNISFFNISGTRKKEIDIVIYSMDFKEKYCIELKYPQHGQYPEQMYLICKDIKFIEQLKGKGFTGGYSINLVSDNTYCKGVKSDGIYSKFREEKRLYGIIEKPTGSKKESFELDGDYKIDWQHRNNMLKYFIIKV